ncbi:MAG TPA: DUF5916 domain-containing protein [Kofleriaceae bacterium]|jgi:hypothetical protein|nr:DUF5916 domain-containing protein [Kofleriaceae bacterium]
MKLLACVVVVCCCIRPSLGAAAPDTQVAPSVATPETPDATAPAPATVPAAAGPSAPPAADLIDSLPAHRVTGGIQIDGRLDEEAWRDAAGAGRFAQEAPHYGEPATSPTEVRVLYDDQYLYIGARMRHLPGHGGVTSLVHRRDRDSASDWFGVAIDSAHDRRTAHEFRVNASGVQRDVLLYADTSSDDTWDAVWDSGVFAAGGEWTAELRIPLSLLRIRAVERDQTWGINFVRVDQDPQETDRWHVVARSENAFVSKFPLLVGLSGLRPQARREIIPYLTLNEKVATAQGFDDRGVDVRAGVDAHLGLGASSLLDLTFLPDFGQTEVDQVIINLSTIETLFPEKRAFFLEGSELFQVNGTQLFYSRRIGASAPLPVLGPGETVLARPLALDILGAAKFTGKYESGLNVGVVAAETEPAYARVRQADGTVANRLVAPTIDSAVTRVLQQVDPDGSYVGAFSSLYVERDGGRRSYVGAADATWKSHDGSAQVDALGGGSAGSADRTSGATANARAIKRFDAGWYVTGNGDFATRYYNPNDLGYIISPDHILGHAEVGRQWDRTLGVFRNWSFAATEDYGQDHAAMTFNDTVGGKVSTGFTNDWTAYLGGGNGLPYYDDRELRAFLEPKKKYLHHGNEPYLIAGFTSSHQSPWYVGLDVTVQHFAGGPTYTATLNQTIHPSSRFEIQLETDLLDAQGEMHWLETQGETPIVGIRRMRQASQIVRASYAFTPNLTLQAYTQLLLASWHYGDLASYVDDNTLAPGAMSQTTSFTANNFNINAVLRWELRPGCTLYTVYTHGAFNDEVFHQDATLASRSISALLHAPADDVLQLKLSWLFR